MNTARTCVQIAPEWALGLKGQYGYDSIIRRPGVCSYLALPLGREDPGLVLLQEIFGVNQDMRALLLISMPLELFFLRQHAACTGKVGALGFCLGGKLAYLLATRFDPDSSVVYCGVGIESALAESADNAHDCIKRKEDYSNFTTKPQSGPFFEGAFRRSSLTVDHLLGELTTCVRS